MSDQSRFGVDDTTGAHGGFGGPSFRRHDELYRGLPGGSFDGDHVLVDPNRYSDRFGTSEGGKPVSRARVCVHDDYMKSDTIKNLLANTNPLLDNFLGIFDQLAIHIVAGDARVGGTAPLSLGAWIQHSADGINWMNKSLTQEVVDTQLISGSSDTSKVITLKPGYDDGSLPSLAFVRIRLNLKTTGIGSAAPISAKIKVHVTCNDRNEKHFVQHQEHQWDQRVERARAAQERAQKQHQQELEHRSRVRACAREYRALQRLSFPRPEIVETRCAKQGVSLDELMTEVHRQRDPGRDDGSKQWPGSKLDLPHGGIPSGRRSDP